MDNSIVLIIQMEILYGQQIFPLSLKTGFYAKMVTLLFQSIKETL